MVTGSSLFDIRLSFSLPVSKQNASALNIPEFVIPDLAPKPNTYKLFSFLSFCDFV